MSPEQIQAIAEGLPPSAIGKDHEEVVTWLANQLIALQLKVNALEPCRRCGVRPLRPDSAHYCHKPQQCQLR